MKKLLVAVLMTGALAAQAQGPVVPGLGSVVKPRVFVIFDTSTSMRAPPDYELTGVGLTAAENDDTSTDPDMSPVSDLVCRSKFCIAKKVVYDSLKSYADNVRLGVASYYQYMVKYEPIDTRMSRCWYDSMWKPGQTLRLPRNGAWYSDVDMGSIPSTVNVDLSSAQPTAVIKNNSNHQFCRGTTATYNLTQESMGMTSVTCRVYDRPTMVASVTLGANDPTAAGCDPRTYSVSGFNNELTPGAGLYYRYRIPTGNSCPAGVTPGPDYSGTPADRYMDVTNAANSTTCSAVNSTNCWESTARPFGGTVSDTCSTGNPCRMYSASTGVEPSISTSYSWIGFFSGACNTGLQPGAPNLPGESNLENNAGVCAAPTTVTTPTVPGGFYDTTRIEGPETTYTYTVTDPTGGDCQGFYANAATYGFVTAPSPGLLSPRRVTSGPISNWNDRTNAQLATLAGVPASSVLDPNRPTDCNQWPCDVTLTARNGPIANITNTTVNACTVGPNVTCNDGAVGDPLTKALKTGGSCPAITGAPQSDVSAYFWDPGATVPSCNGSATGQCTFTAAGPSETTVAMPGCGSPVLRWDGSTPAACTYHGVTAPAYAPGSTATYTVYKDEPAGSSCTSTMATAAFSSSNTAARDACIMSGSCPLSSPVSSDSPNSETTTSSTSLDPPLATPAWGSPVNNYSGSFIDLEADQCGAIADGAVQVMNSGGDKLVIFRRGSGANAGPNGSMKVGVVLESPIYKCRFEIFTRTWSRPKTRCTYTIGSRQFTVAATITWCQYNLKQIQRGVDSPYYTCSYRTPVRRFEFQRPSYKVCSYFTTETVMKRDTPQVRFTYQTKGGELIGSYFREFPTLNAVTAPYADIAASCPVTIDNCQGAGTVCHLRTSNANPAAFASPPFNQISTTAVVSTGAVANRYSNFSSNTNLRFRAPAGTAVPGGSRFSASLTPDIGGAYIGGHMGSDLTGSGRACVMSDFAAPPLTPSATQTAFASYNGAVLPERRFKLVSGYMNCADDNNPASCTANSIASINGDPRPAPNTLNPGASYMALTDADWTTSATMAYGASATGPLYQNGSMMMMGFPPDNDATGNVSRFKQLMSGCKRPVANVTDVNTQAAVTWPAPASSSTIIARNGDKVDWSPGGLCMPDVGQPNAAGMEDFTPLYSSLRNVKKYLEHQLDADNNHQCRRYFVVLATDGKENTPNNASYATEAALTSAVTSLRNTTSPSGRVTDVNTFVLGFGSSVASADEYKLNQMAIAGNTGGAYFAANRADLQVRLAQIFNSITQGTYSRSRPVLTSDGTGLYAAYFDIRSSTAEQQGHLAAIGFDSGGNQLTRWEFGQKLNDGMTDGDRNIFTMAGAPIRVKTPWLLANAATITPLLNDDVNYPPFQNYPGPTVGTTHLDPVRVLSFVRNIAKVTGAPTTGENFFQSGTPDKRLSRYAPTVRSVPVVVSRSFNSPDWGGKSGQASRTSYATFQANVLNREQRVVFGSADGLIRSVRDRITDPACVPDESSASCPNGKEGWGWVATAVQPTLYKTLLGPPIPGVDGDIWLEDICATSDAEDCSVANWRTVAFVGMRGGGRGVQAIDVTDPTNPNSLWSFQKYGATDGNLGYPVTAAVGRVEVTGNHDRYIAVIPGGTRRGGVYGDLNTVGRSGDEVYVLNAANGSQMAFFNGDPSGDCGEEDEDEDAHWDEILGCDDNELIAKPSYFRRSNSPYMDNMVLNGTSGLTYIMRFRKKVKIEGSGEVKIDPREDSSKWAPRRFFDPTSTRTSKDPLGNEVRVRRVVDMGGGAYQLQYCEALADGSTCGTLPLPADRRLPFHNRARVAAVYDTAGLVADYYFGTGDSINPLSPAPEFVRNYFYAVHDGNRRDDGRDDGRPMWVNQFIDRREQVIGDPVLVNGNILVSTYLPPPTSLSDCTEVGDARLYCFNPKNGNLVDCLVNGGTATSVRTMTGIGIPAPPQCIGNNCYVLGSNSPPGPDGTPRLERTAVVPPTPSGDTRSFRRVR